MKREAIISLGDVVVPIKSIICFYSHVEKNGEIIYFAAEKRSNFRRGWYRGWYISKEEYEYLLSYFGVELKEDLPETN
ncbi:MAG: hypothetical protein LBR37_03845 [Erysipelotrichaceae bacterium]|jgi:hypothetical protein|nr:hypothetical protein [Erysipelotrichaceae bacterium]